MDGVVWSYDDLFEDERIRIHDSVKNKGDIVFGIVYAVQIKNQSEERMKIAIAIGVAAFMLADAFLMWCLLRANALYERNENKHEVVADHDDERPKTPNETNEKA